MRKAVGFEWGSERGGGGKASIHRTGTNGPRSKQYRFTAPPHRKAGTAQQDRFGCIDTHPLVGSVRKRHPKGGKEYIQHRLPHRCWEPKIAAGELPTEPIETAHPPCHYTTPPLASLILFGLKDRFVRHIRTLCERTEHLICNGVTQGSAPPPGGLPLPTRYPPSPPPQRAVHKARL